MRPFHALTRTGQLRRLRQLAIAALPSFGLGMRRLQLASGSFNAIYRLDADDGQRYAVRVHRAGYRTREMVEAEAVFLQAVARDGRVEVPAPVFAGDGMFTALVAYPGVGERLVSVIRWLPGAPIAERKRVPAIERFGAAIATLHDVGSALGGDATAGLPLADTLFYDGPVGLLGHAAVRECPEPHVHDVLERGMERAEAVYSHYVRSGREAIPVHGDLHLYNAQRHRSGRVGVLDFDDSVRCWPEIDLGISYFYVAAIHPTDEGEPCWAALRRGYEQVAEWPVEQTTLQDLAIARQLSILNSLLKFDPSTLDIEPTAYVAKAAQRIEHWLGS